MLNFSGRPAELITAIDITQHKLAEAEVRQALAQAKQLSELRARFVSVICYQFRTPLNIVSFSASLLKRHVHRWSEEKSQAHLAHIQTAVEQINQLLDEILLLGRPETAIKLEPNPLNLERFCRQLAAYMQLTSSQNEITVVSRGNCSGAWVDQKLLQPILVNLLANAIKYSPPASAVVLRVSCSDTEAVFQVKDAGIGIPAADQQRLFEPFFRGSNVGDLPGTGLGLSIVKTLVDLHRGHIAVTSEVGVGTTFTVTLPLVNQ